MLKRKIYDTLMEWKGRKHKSLVISGQRQIGKTFIIREFAKNEYDNILELNFAENPSDKEIFIDSLSTDSIIQRLSVSYPGVDIIPSRTLIFLDEIQDCQEAYSSLKYFTDDGRYDVIASGSLLGIKMPNLSDSEDEPNVLIPMGYEECITMYALDFEEFLWAKGIKEDIINDIKKRIHDGKKIDDVILDRFNGYFREYMITGGMPDSVSAFIETGTFASMNRILKDLNQSCLKDINRYNTGIDILKTTECYESIPDQLSESNKKFMYSRIKGEGSRKAADRYEENILWIKGAGYGNFCYAVKDMALPLRSKRDHFRIYQSDTGMLINRYGENCLKAIYKNDMSYNIGAIAENAVAEGLMKSGYLPRFHSVSKGKNHMELDFVVETGDGLCAIEVKSGKDRNAPSLSKAMRIYKIDRSIMLSDENIYTDDNGVEHFPMFAACFFRELEPEWDGPTL